MGKAARSGSWETGVDGVWPETITLANPLVWVWHRQECYQGEAEDVAELSKLNESASVAYGSFDSVLVTKAWTPLEPGVVELGY